MSGLDLLHSLRDISLCMFITVAIAAALLPGAIFFLLARGIRILKRRGLPYVHLAQFYARRSTFYADRASRAVVAPILFTAGWTARLRNYATQFGRWIRQEES